MSLVLGGGVSGLAAAHYLLKNAAKHHKVKLIEGSHRVGGWITTTTSPEGIVFEHGPRTIRPRGPQGANTLELVEELGLSSLIRPIRSNHPAALNRMVYVKKQLHSLPSSLASLFKLNPPFSKPLISSLVHDFKAPKKVKHDESIYDFVERRLGTEVADYAISPMICGICAGDAKEISVKFLMQSLFDAEQQHGSIVRGMFRNMWKDRKKPKVPLTNELAKRALAEKWSVWSLIGGLENLPQTMRRSILNRGGEIKLNEKCRQIVFPDTEKVLLLTTHGQHAASHLYCSLSAKALAPLLRKQHAALSHELSEIPMVSVAVVNLQYEGQILKNEGFGFLIPPSEKVPILGVIYDSCCFPCGDNTVLTVMMGGRWFEEQFGANPSNDFILDTAITQVSEILGVSAYPQTHNVSILKDCIPQYVVGHQDRVKRIRNYIKKNSLPLSLIGASYDGVGVNDVIMSARNAVKDST